MSSTISGDEPLHELPKMLRDRDSIMSVLREGSRAAREDVSKLWRQQARSLNRFSKALEDFSVNNHAPAQHSLARMFGRGNPSSSLLSDKKSTELLGDINDNSRDQVNTLGEIYELLHDDAERQRKRDLLNATVASKTLDTLTHILKALGHVGSGGGLIEDLLAGKGAAGLFGGGRAKALTSTAEAVALAERRPGLIRRTATNVASHIPGFSYIGGAARSAGGAIARAPSALYNMLPLGAQSVLSTGARAGMGAGRILGTAGRAGGRLLGALGGSVATPLAALGLMGSLGDLSNQRNTPFMGNEQTGGILGSRMANYAQSALSGATIGGVGGAAFGGVGAIPGAIIGGLAGLGTAAYADFKPQVDAFSGKILGYVSDGLNNMWMALGGAIKDVFVKLPQWALHKILSDDQIKALVEPGKGAPMTPAQMYGGGGPQPDINKMYGGGGPQPDINKMYGNAGSSPASPNQYGYTTGGSSTPNAPAVSYQPGDLLSKVGINTNQYGAFREGVAGIESHGKYDIMGGSSGRFAGRYQMGATEIRETAAKLGVPAPSQQEFLSNPGMQEKFFEAYTAGHHDYLMKNSPEYAAASPEDKLKILGYAHNQGAGGAATYLKTGAVGKDAFGTAGTKYGAAIGKNLDALKQGGGDQPIGTAQASTPGAATPSTTGSVAIGDSIAKGVGTAGGIETSAKVGDNPQAVLARIRGMGNLSGKDVILSSGVSNNPQQSELVEQQITALKAQGAGNIKLMGVGGRQDFAGLNDKLAAVAQKTGATFTGGFQAGKDQVHPADYKGLYGDINKSGVATAQNPTASTLEGSNAARRDAFTERAGLDEKNTGGKETSAGFEMSDNSEKAAPTPPPAPAPDKTAQNGSGYNVDLDQVPMYISDNGMIYMNSHSVA